MIKKILQTGIFVLLTLSFGKVTAQTLWEAVPLQFDYPPGIMYYDSTEEVSYIAGDFTTVNGIPCNIVKYDGTNYTLMPPSPLYATGRITRYHDKLYVSGYGMATWDGSQWEYVDSAIIGPELYVFNDKLYVTGTFDSIAGHQIRKGAIWNDTTWTDFYRIDTITQTDFFFPSRIINYKGRFYVAGNFNEVTTDSLINEITMFDGQRWTNVGGQIKGDFLSGVNDLAIWRDTLYVGGGFKEVTGSPGNNIAKWDGVNWHRLNNGVSQDNQAAVVNLLPMDDALYASGWFYIVDGHHLGAGHKGFAKWDGNRWCTMATVGDGTLMTLGRWKDQLFLMGGFHHLNGQPMEFMAKWVGGNYTDSCYEPTTTGIDNINKLSVEVSLYPNPTEGKFTIKISDWQPGTQLVIYDLAGRICYQGKLSSPETIMDISGFAGGLFAVKVTSDKYTWTGKLLLDRH